MTSEFHFDEIFDGMSTDNEYSMSYQTQGVN
jgi:hypothetical protein